MELGLIQKIRQLAAGSSSDEVSARVARTIGDDCAEVIPSPGKNLLITTDTMCENVHFSLSYFSPWQLGAKLASVNLSDIAAMAGTPRWAVLNAEVPEKLSNTAGPFWGDFLRGLISRLLSFGTVLVGGDTVRSSSDKLSLTLTLLGEIDPGGAIYRSEAREGDLVYCSGYTGEAACGLEILENSSISPAIPGAVRKRLTKRHLSPEPRIELGKALARTGINSLIDTSDGIASDLAHVAQESRLRAVVFQELLPVSRSIRVFCKALARGKGLVLPERPQEYALFGGEDFELIWTVSPPNRKAVERVAAEILGYPPLLIGFMEGGSGCFLDMGGSRLDISFKGYEH